VSLGIAIADAADNCVKQGAVARLTLRSGAQFTGTIKRSNVDLNTVHISIGSGWATILEAEIAAVQSLTREEAA
jgi:hypothetical protein